MNLVFHIVATCGLVGLLYWVLMLQKDLKFLRSMVECSYDEKSRVYLDTPDRFLEKFAQAFDIEVFGDMSKSQSMIKIDPRGLSNLHCNYGIKSMHLGPGDELQHVELVLRNWDAEVEKAASNLDITLANKVTFNIRGRL